MSRPRRSNRRSPARASLDDLLNEIGSPAPLQSTVFHTESGSKSSVWSVNALAELLRATIDEQPMLRDMWIEGEVSNTFFSRSGHCWFTLRDDASQIKAIIFRDNLQAQRRPPQDGDLVLAHGRIGFYPKDGAIQLYADLIDQAGRGVHQLRRELLHRTLAAEGLFDERRKRPIPSFPQTIGIVTSPDGAVWHDIQRVIERRYPLVRLILAPASVQGEGAVTALVTAMRAVGRDPAVDLVILARGGGSTEDLACFDDEAVARAVAACPVPVITGVGHETDWTIVDYVADVRAPTPSVAAELAVPSRDALRERLNELVPRLHDAIHDAQSLANQRQEHLSSRMRFASPSFAIAHGHETYQRCHDALDRAIALILDQREARAEGRRAVLEALSPTAVLERGFALLEDDNKGVVVSSRSNVFAGQRLTGRVADGAIPLTVHMDDEGTPMLKNAPPTTRPSSKRRAASDSTGQIRMDLGLRRLTSQGRHS